MNDVHYSIYKIATTNNNNNIFNIISQTEIRLYVDPITTLEAQMLSLIPQLKGKKVQDTREQEIMKMKKVMAKYSTT